MKPSSEEKAEALVTWRCAFTANALAGLFAAFAPSFGLVNFVSTSGSFVISRAAVLTSAIVLLGVLVPQRRHPRLWIARIAFALPALPVLVMYWFLDRDRATQGLPVELFAHPLAASVAFAALTPPRATISLLAIAAFSTENLLMFCANQRTAPIPGWQPWSNLLAACGLALLALYRAHRQRQEVAILAEAEQAKGLHRLLGAYRAVRDLVNTPLQTLWVSATLLATRYPEAREVTGSMVRSVERLNELNEVLTAEASTVEWPPGTEAFDSLTVLQTLRAKPGP
jgi:hypothetical protein